jgi:hypothetical protein
MDSEESRLSGLHPVTSVQRQEQKDPRERLETPREEKDRSVNPREHPHNNGGQNTPTAAPGRSAPTERERSSRRTSFGGYQGL